MKALFENICVASGIVIEAQFIREFLGYKIFLAQDRIVVTEDDNHEIFNLDLLELLDTEIFNRRLRELHNSDSWNYSHDQM